MQIIEAAATVRLSNEWFIDRFERYGTKSLYLPAGETPRLLYADWRLRAPEALRQMQLYQVDDITSGKKAGLFRRFFQEELPGFRVLPPERDVQADLAILGLGTNGHLAFHEPGMPVSFRFGSVALHPETRERLGLAPSDEAVSFGLGAFLATRSVLLLVRGENKRRAFQAFKNGDPALPATALQAHSDLTVISEI
jgi:6-phosphogluconolactonase/glucosamine-6-phosphate isomerase/deaminase